MPNSTTPDDDAQPSLNPATLTPGTLNPGTLKPGTLKPGTLKPATPQEVQDALSFALRFRGRRRVDVAGPAIAQIAAEHLCRHLEESGFVVMKRPDAVAPSTTRHLPPKS